MAKDIAQLNSDIDGNVLSGGRRTKAANVRPVLKDIVSSSLNIVDGGNIIQALSGYTSELTLTDRKNFTYRGWVEDYVASQIGADLTPYFKKDGSVDATGNFNLATHNIINLGSLIGAGINTGKQIDLGSDLAISSSSGDIILSTSGSNNINLISSGGASILADGDIGLDATNINLTFSILNLNGVALAPGNAGTIAVTSDLSAYLPLTGGTLTGNLNGVTPTELSYLSGATSNIQTQINNINSGLSWKQAIRVATTANITLSGTQTIDGIAVIAGDRVLVKNQSTAAQNGIYVCASGAWSRSTDAATGSEILQATVSIEEGTANADTIYTCTTDAPITIGSTSIAFAKTSATTYTGSNGITLSSNNFTLDNSYFSGDATISAGVISIGSGKVTNTMLAGSIAYSKLSLTGAILNADLAGSIAYSKLSLTGAILNADLAGSIASSKLVGTDIATVGTIISGTWNGTKISEVYGGTNQSTYTLGDILYSSAANTLSKLAGNTTSTNKFLIQTGTGSVSAAPSWGTISAGDVPTLNQNTTGSAASLTTARTIGGVSFDGTANITVATATGGFTISGGDLALGANNIIMTGSIGTTGARLTKGWFTDLQVTNSISGSITGNAATVTTNANLTGVITSVGNATSIASQTGTGTKFVVDTSPTLVTPILGVASSTSETITGTGGNGFISLKTQSSNPAAPSDGTLIFSNSNSKLSWRGSANNFVKTFDGSAATADRVYSLPDVAGTIITTGDTGTVTNAMLAGSIDLTTKVTGILPGTNGGSGVNNSTRTMTYAGNVAFTGAFNATFSIPQTTTWTFPNTASETLAGLGTAQTFTAKQTFTASTTEIASLTLLDTTYKTGLDVSATNTLRIGNGFTTLSIPTSTVSLATSVNFTCPSAATGIQLTGNATSTNAVIATRTSSVTTGSGTFNTLNIGGTFAASTGSGTYNGVTFAGTTINQTNSGSAPTGVTSMININPTVTSVITSLYGIRSQIAVSPTGGGTAWNIYADGTAANGFGGDVKLLTAGNGFYIKEGTNATMGTGTLVGGTLVVNTTKVTASSRIFLTDTGGGVLANIGALYISARTAGTSFTVSSSNALDTSNFTWIIIEPA